jgi:hypothetical protein
VGAKMKSLVLLISLGGCGEYRCYYPPQRDVFMTRCLEHLDFSNCDYNARIQGWGERCVKVEPAPPGPKTTSHYSLAGQ